MLELEVLAGLVALVLVLLQLGQMARRHDDHQQHAAREADALLAQCAGIEQAFRSWRDGQLLERAREPEDWHIAPSIPIPLPDTWQRAMDEERKRVKDQTAQAEAWQRWVEAQAHTQTETMVKLQEWVKEAIRRPPVSTAEPIAARSMRMNPPVPVTEMLPLYLLDCDCGRTVEVRTIDPRRQDRPRRIHRHGPSGVEIYEIVSQGADGCAYRHTHTEPVHG